VNPLITQCALFVKQCSIPYCIGGGYALELFIDRSIRPHSDLDVCIFEEDKEQFIKFMFNHDWVIYEPQNNGLCRLISDPDTQKIEQI
jgi:hypothetical protein